MPDKIIFIRHAESVNNELNSNQYTIISGQDDCELSAYGLQKLKQLKLPNIAGFDIYSSPAKRCLVTCNKLFPQKKAEISELLMERSLGIWEGRTLTEIEKDAKVSEKLKKQLKSRIYRHSFSFRFPTAENYTDVENRCLRFLQGLSANTNVIIASHMTTIRCFLKILLNLSKQQSLNLRISNIEPIYINKIGSVYKPENPLSFF